MQAWKLAATLLFVLVVGAIAWLVEYLTDRFRPEMGGVMRFVILFLLAIAIGFAALQVAHGHDHKRPGLDGWYSGLRSGHGPCCDGPGVDAVHLSDVDWESKDGRYRVRIDGEWIDVPDGAVLQQPNRDGRTLVWPTWQEGRRVVRCFIPGSMT